MPPKAPKAPITCNWMWSNVTDDTLADFVKTGYLPKKEIMSYRAPDPSEERPQPRDGEVVIFADHMSRGFAPPGSKFFRDVLNFFCVCSRSRNFLTKSGENKFHRSQ